MSELLSGVKGSILVVDEDFPHLHADSFIREMYDSDNYFILVSRRKFSNLPYSYTELYHLCEKRYGDAYCMYNDRVYGSSDCRFNPDIVVTEDSRSGYQMLYWYKRVSAGSNAKVADVLASLDGKHERICAVADGAAFGSCIQDAVSVVRSVVSDMTLFLPESTEYVLLRAGVCNVKREWLDRTYDFCDEKFFWNTFGIAVKGIISWERFYTRLLSQLSGYDKGHLSEYYL